MVRSFARWLVLTLAIGAVVCLFLSTGCSSDENTAPQAADAGDGKDDGNIGKGPGAGNTPDSASPGDDGNTPLAPLPVLANVRPDHATAGTAGPPLIATGAGFVPQSVIQIDGAPLPTQFVSDTELRATLPSAKLLKAGTLQIAVGTAPPGGGLSQPVTFTVNNPAPQLTQISPQSALAGAADTALTLSGAGFVQGAVASFEGTSLVTTFVTQTSLTATIPAALLTGSGNRKVVVTNPQPGGGTSTGIAFVVTNPTVTVTSVSPPSVVVGAPGQTLTVVGTGFVPASAVSLNGATLGTTFVDATHLTAQATAALFANVGSFPVVVTNPEPGGGVSTPVTFQVQNAAPTIAAVSPSSAPAGSGATQITVIGTGYGALSQVTFDDVVTSTTFVDGQHLQATLSAAQLAAAGSIAVRVANPMPGGGTSSAVSFAITNPTPVITSVSPASVAVGAADTPLTVNGANFIPGASVNLGGTNLATSYVSGTQLTATAPASLFTTVRSLPLTVTNPAPGGGASLAVSFPVTCDTSNVDVVLNGSTVTRDLVWDFTAPISERFSKSSTCPAQIPNITTNPQPYRAFVVQNGTLNTATLSTWAVCSSTVSTESDGFVAVYRAGVVPTALSDRLACSGAVSEGASGIPSLPSPESNGSNWCPALTKSLGAGLSLAACEKAVVYVQTYSVSSVTYLPPTKVRFALE